MDTNWNLYRSFLAVLRTGSLTGAARSLDLTQPTLGRHIEELEASLGALFLRSQAGLLPTELGTRLRTHAEMLEANVASLIRAASFAEAEVSGVVRVTAGETFACEWLPEIFESILIQHPQLKIELVVSNKIDNLARREADIAVRLIQPVQSVLLSKKVGEVEIALHAHADYLKKRGVPKSVADLKRHTLIGYDNETEFVRSITKRIGEFPGRSDFNYKTDSDLAYLALIRAKCGIGFCQTKIASREKTLKRVLSTTATFRLGVWIAMHEDLKSHPGAYVLFKAMAVAFQKRLG